MNKKSCEKQIVLELDQICKDNEIEILNSNYEKRPICSQFILRLGVELLGHFFDNEISKNIIGFGAKESKIMDSLDSNELDKNLNKIFEYKPPLVICSLGVNDKNKKLLLNKCNEFKTPYSEFPSRLSHLNSTLGMYITEKLSEEEFVHGSFMEINGIGVLITGESGIGKSEAVVELIQKGHIFISDDALIVKRVGNRFVGITPTITKNLVEVRGIGLINVRDTFGSKSVKDKYWIDLVVELKASELQDFDRIGNKKYYYEILNGKIKKIIIPVKTGRSISSLIEVAIISHISKIEGDNLLDKLDERMKNE